MHFYYSAPFRKLYLNLFCCCCCSCSSQSHVAAHLYLMTAICICVFVHGTCPVHAPQRESLLPDVAVPICRSLAVLPCSTCVSRIVKNINLYLKRRVALRIVLRDATHLTSAHSFSALVTNPHSHSFQC